jgi:predicted ATPase
MGSNGAGKTTLFEILHILQQLIIQGTKVADAFPTTTLTRWQDREEQLFEFELNGNNGVYRYILEIEHSREKQLVRMKREAIFFDGKPLYAFEILEEEGIPVSHAQLYRDDYSKGPKVPFDWSRSGLLNIQNRPDNTKLTWFKERMRRFWIARLNPPLMAAESRFEVEQSLPDLSNFADWFRYLAQDMGKIMALTHELRKVLEHFDSFKLEPAGLAKILQVKFAHQKPLCFNELSDGQRALIGLYSLLYAFEQDEDYTLCIDEPENYLALAEIDPWFNAVYDRYQEGYGQVLLISHHPKFINTLACNTGYWLSRPNNGPTRCQLITDEQGKTGVSMADLVERGWIYAQ